MREELIAPCGMNCSLCISYQFQKHDLNKKGFHRTYCPGCIPRGKNCTHMKSTCEKLGEGKIRFCFLCENFPCKRLKDLDRRYRTKYHMSMIHNLSFIKENGLEDFLELEELKWKCLECGGTICCHNGLCLNCSIDTLVRDKKYRWDEEGFQMIEKMDGPRDIDEYIDQFPEDVQEILEKIRGVIREAAPEATEKISYQMPTFYLKGNLVHFAAFRNHIGFYPTPSGITSFDHELAPYKRGKGSVRFPLDEPIPYDLIERIVRFRVRENLKTHE